MITMFSYNCDVMNLCSVLLCCSKNTDRYYEILFHNISILPLRGTSKGL